MLISKKGFRALGIAESFERKDKISVLAAVSMRADGVIDGVYITYTTVGGLDATDKIIELVRSSGRKDIRIILVSGCIISWFNIVDVDRIHKELGIPTVCITYEESEGIEKFIREYFPNDEKRLELYRKLGPREELYLKTGHKIYVRYAGITKRELRTVLNKFTKSGSTPEPIRVAALVASATRKFLKTLNSPG